MKQVLVLSTLVVCMLFTFASPANGADTNGIDTFQNIIASNSQVQPNDGIPPVIVP